MTKKTAFIKAAAVIAGVVLLADSAYRLFYDFMFSYGSSHIVNVDLKWWLGKFMVFLPMASLALALIINAMTTFKKTGKAFAYIAAAFSVLSIAFDSSELFFYVKSFLHNPMVYTNSKIETGYTIFSFSTLLFSIPLMLAISGAAVNFSSENHSEINRRFLKILFSLGILSTLASLAYVITAYSLNTYGQGNSIYIISILLFVLEILSYIAGFNYLLNCTEGKKESDIIDTKNADDTKENGEIESQLTIIQDDCEALTETAEERQKKRDMLIRRKRV